MRTPSVKTLSQCFDNPKEAKRILRMRRMMSVISLPLSIALFPVSSHCSAHAEAKKARAMP